MVACVSVKSSSTSSVLSMATSSRFFEVNFEVFVEISVCRMRIKGKIIRLICIVLFELSLLSCLALKFSIVCSWSLESCWVGSILSITLRFVNFKFAWNITLFVLGFVIEFCIIGLVCVSWLISDRFRLFLFIVYIVCRFDDLRVIVAFVQFITTLACSLYRHIICLVHFMICGISIKWNMFGWAVMLILINRTLRQVQI